MKLKKLTGFLVATVAALGITTLTYADTTSSITIGAPIDLSTNTVAENYEAGDIIALPVDVTTTSGKVTAFSAVVEYNTEYLEAGVNTNDTNIVSDEVYTNLLALSGKDNEDNLVKSSDGSKTGALKLMYTEGRGGAKTYVGTSLYNPTYTSNSAYVSWYHTASTDLRETPETYFIFRVTKDVPADSLNFAAFTVSDNVQNAAQDSNGGIDETNVGIDASGAKFNACYGAFNINIDSNALPYWIQALYVKVGDSDAVQVTEYSTTDNVNYAFPVRITSNSGNADAVTVEVLADTSTDEAGNEGTQSKVSMGTFEVQLNSPTSYADQTVSAQ